jgi:hypothetical protein
MHVCRARVTATGRERERLVRHSCMSAASSVILIMRPSLQSLLQFYLLANCAPLYIEIVIEQNCAKGAEFQADCLWGCFVPHPLGAVLAVRGADVVREGVSKGRFPVSKISLFDDGCSGNAFVRLSF